MARSRRSAVYSRRDPPTQRGKDVKGAVKAAASRLLEVRWFDQISLVEVAKAAEVARASLLLQFPQGWPEILFELYFDESPYDETVDRMEACKVGPPVDRVARFLEPLLVRAQETGRLYPNIRGAMFTWGEEFGGVAQCWIEDFSTMLVELMTQSQPIVDEVTELRTFRAAESLYYSALDLASTEWRFSTTWVERQATLRSLIESVFVGLGLPRDEIPSNRLHANIKPVARSTSSKPRKK